MGSETALGVDVRERSHALYCDSGSGELEMQQQDASADAASLMPLSSMFICSQRD
jgi:hypothetical protein